MTFELMRRVDSWLGRPLLLLLRLFTPQLQTLGGSGDARQQTRRVVVTKFLGIGSVALAMPALKALKEANTTVCFWTFTGVAPLLKDSGLVAEVWEINPSISGFLPSLLRALKRCFAFRPEAFIDFEPTANFTSLLARISSAPIRVGFMAAKPLRESLFTHLVSLRHDRHMVENMLALVARLGIPAHTPTSLSELALFKTRTPATDTNHMKRLLVHGESLTANRYRRIFVGAASETKNECGVCFNIQDIRSVGEENCTSTSPTIIINVNSSDLSWHRNWPDHKWKLLCDKLIQQLPQTTLIFPGSKSEHNRVATLLNTFDLATQKRTKNLAGQTTLPGLIDVIHNADLVISIDSGIMHLAALTTTPIIALFGPETPVQFGPYSNNAFVLYENLPCSPCLLLANEKKSACKINICMGAGQ